MGSLFDPGSKTVTTDTTQARNPFAAATPGITQILQGAQGLQPVQPTQSGATQAGIQELIAQARQPTVGGEAGAFGREFIGGTAPRTAVGTLESTAAGEGLSGNPFLDELVRRNTERTVDVINSRFSGIGQRGSPANKEAIADAIARGELGVQAENFQQERGRQEAAASGLLGQALTTAGLSPTLDQGGLFGANQLLRAGGIQDQFSQAQQLAPFELLARQSALVNPIATGFGQTTGTTAQTTPTASLGSQLLGGGLTLAGAALGGPMGAQIGSSIGGMFGGGGAGPTNIGQSQVGAGGLPGLSLLGV